MTTIYAAILILGASGSATRSLEVEDSIAGIVWQVVIGGVKDVVSSRSGSEGETRWDRLDELVQKKEWLAADPTLRIDGETRTGWRAWAGATYRVAGYALDTQTVGRVEYSYTLQVRAFTMRRHTEICDGRVTLTTSTGWVESIKVGRSTKRIPIHVRITIRADETSDGTHLHGTATGYADTADFGCRLVRRIAEQRAAAELRTGLDRCLVGIQDGGTKLYQHGASDVLSIVRESIRIGGRR